MSGTSAAAAAESPPARRVCVNCGGAAQKRCSECKKRGIAVYYCGRECQLRDWKAHKKHCGTAQAQNVDIQRILFVNPEEGTVESMLQDVSDRAGWQVLDFSDRLLRNDFSLDYFKRVFSSHAGQALNNDFSLDDFKQYFHASVDLGAQLLLDIRELHDPADVVHVLHHATLLKRISVVDDRGREFRKGLVDYVASILDDRDSIRDPVITRFIEIGPYVYENETTESVVRTALFCLGGVLYRRQPEATTGFRFSSKDQVLVVQRLERSGEYTKQWLPKLFPTIRR